jgi:hypothetical protein
MTLIHDRCNLVSFEAYIAKVWLGTGTYGFDHSIRSRWIGREKRAMLHRMTMALQDHKQFSPAIFHQPITFEIRYLRQPWTPDVSACSVENKTFCGSRYHKYIIARKDSLPEPQIEARHRLIDRYGNAIR